MATPPKKNLGRGLGSLIGGGINKPAAATPAPAVAATTAVVGLSLLEIPLGQICLLYTSDAADEMD
jgi:hypothetical protein